MRVRRVNVLQRNRNYDYRKFRLHSIGIEIIDVRPTHFVENFEKQKKKKKHVLYFV